MLPAWKTSPRTIPSQAEEMSWRVEACPSIAYPSGSPARLASKPVPGRQIANTTADEASARRIAAPVTMPAISPGRGKLISATVAIRASAMELVTRCTTTGSRAWRHPVASPAT